MKKVLLTLILLIPALFASAQGPIKTWNDQLDDFIECFNQVDPAYEQLYNDNGVSTFIFTYFEPDSGNVVKEASIFDMDGYNKVDDAMMNQAKSVVVKHLADSAKKSQRINSILNEFAKRGTNIVLLYSTNNGDNKLTKQIVITPSEIK